MDVVSRQAQRLKKSCSKSNAEWSELSVAITELADAVEALDADDHREAVSEHLLPLAADFAALLRNIRSKLVSDVCEQLGRIVKTTCLAFSPLANALLEPLASTAKASSVAIRSPGFQLFSDVSEYSRYDLEVLQRVYRSSPQERVKSLLFEQLQIVLASWPKDDIEPYYIEMLEIMRRGMLDPSSHVRTACRQTFCSFSDIWHERLEELVTIPSPPARDLLMKEKPHAAITKAIRRKFNIETPKDSRAESIRLRRSAVRRQGSSTVGTSDDPIFVEVKESPRRPSQRKVTAEPPTRSASPGRGPTRSASPSSTARATTSAARSASPSAPVRGASPSRATTRAPSPSRASKDAVRAPSVRSASPGRGQTITPAVNGRMPASPPAPVRNNEFDRYLNDSLLENKAAPTTTHEVQEPKQAAPSRPQKRVSIMEPTSISQLRDSSRYHHMPLGNQQFSSREERYPSMTDYLARDDAFASPPPSSPSDASSPPRNRYTADAREFVSQSRTKTFAFNTDSPQFESNKSEGHNERSREIESYGEFTLPTRPDWLQPPSQSVQEETMLDSYLDRPIPSSAPAPEPRAPANVTQRDRRRYIDRDVVEPAEKPSMRNLAEPSGLTHVAGAPVPGDERTVGTRHSAADRDLARSSSDDEPPSVSIDSAFHMTNMATIGPSNDNAPSPVSAVDTPDHDLIDNEEFDKENVRDSNIRHNDASAQPNMKERDALANLDAIRAGVQRLRESHMRSLGDNEHKVMPSFAYQRDSKPLPPQQSDGHLTVRTRQAMSIKEQPQQVIEESRSSREEDVRYMPQPQHQNFQPSYAPQQATRVTLPAPQTQAQPLRRDQPSRQPTTESVPETKPATDFVRAPAGFAFAPTAQPAQQAQRAQAPPPKNVPVEKLRHEVQNRKGAQGPLNGERPPINALHSGVTPSDSSTAPTHERTRPPHASRPQVPEQGRSMQPAEGSVDTKPTDRQKPFSLNPGLPARSDKQTTAPAASNTQSAREPPRRTVPAAIPMTESVPNRRHTVLNPKPERINVGVASKMVYSFCLILGTIFGVSGLIQAVTKVRDAYEYHNALLNRINQFESSIVESYESVRKMDEKYEVWSEYVRELTEQDESNALHQLESIQVEVEKWQVEMKNDLVEFKRSLSGDIIDAALAHLREPNTTSEASTANESAP